MYGENVNALTTLVFTLYGMPLIYNGQETGNDQILDYFHDTKIKWTIGNRKMYNTLRTLIALKHTQKALSHGTAAQRGRSEEHTSELQSRQYLVCRLLLEKKNKS